jgi:hypothetical protein
MTSEQDPMREGALDPESPASDSARPKSRKARLHWHVVLTHFPISAAAGAFLFMGLHLATRVSCYVLAAYVSLIAAAVMTIPAAATGWFTWKRRYKGSSSRLFLIKIWTSAVMIPLSIALVVYQATHPFTLLEVAHRLAHSMYFVGVLLLMAGAGVEGYWGGQLHHH